MSEKIGQLKMKLGQIVTPGKYSDLLSCWYHMKKLFKKKRIILIIIGVLIGLGIAAFLYRDKVHCRNIQRRCIMYDLSEIENEEDLEFYRSLNEKCAGRCGTAELELKRKKALCRFKYKRHVESSKDRVYFKADIYNPCPELYTIPELNEWIKGE